MSVTSIREIASTRGADSSGISEIKLSRIWRVITDNANDGPTTIFRSGLLPNLYDPHPDFPFCIAQLARVQQEKGSFFWLVTIEYSSKPIRQEKIDRETHPNPADRPMRVSMSSTQKTKIPRVWYKCDANGNPASTTSPILNSAGDTYDQLVEIDSGRRAFHCVKNFGSQNVPDWVFSFPNVCVNNAPITLLGRSCDIRTMKLSGIAMSELMQEQEFEFYQISFDLQYNVDGWLYDVVDRGFNYLGTANDFTTKKAILNKKDGSKPSVPQLLDGNGAVLADPETATAVLLKGAVYPEVDFSQLPPEG